MPDLAPSINNRRIRIALVGCGRISKNHIKAIAVHHKQAELIAICDTNSIRLQEALELIGEIQAENADALQIPISFNDYNDLIREVKAGNIAIDLVVLVTPSGLHPSQAIAAADAGIHVCTEKPMATKWSDGCEMVKVCDDAGVKLFVVKQNRFNKTLRLVKRQIENGRFGRLFMVTVNVFWQRPQSYYDTDAWRGTWELDGGALMNQASHYVDLLEWLAGPVETVSASISTLAREIEAEDTAALQMRWKSGTLGTMAVTMLTYPKNLEGSITILGETGTVRIGGPAVNQIEHWSFSDQSEDDQLIADASYETSSVYGFGHPLYYSNMLDALQGKCSVECDGKEGLRSLGLIHSAYRSAVEKTVVTCPKYH